MNPLINEPMALAQQPGDPAHPGDSALAVVGLEGIPLEKLAAMYLDAKNHEVTAIARRKMLAEAIAARVPGKSEGVTRTEAGHYSVAVTHKLNRKVDTDALQKRWEHLPANVQRTFRWQAECDVKHLRALQDLTPHLFAAACEFITSTPAAVSVAVVLP